MVIWPDATDPFGDRGIEALSSEARLRLGPVPDSKESPLVSIVVVNRDGVDHLRRLLPGLVEQTDYPDFELILVDNGSTDGSLGFIRSVKAEFPISIVANHHNESLSDAHNQGAELARGELLLFLNNDIEPFEAGWLRELVGCLRANQAGIAGATLVFPKKESEHGYLVQHRAMLLADGRDLLPADQHGHGDEPFGEGFGEDADAAIPSGACMLIESDLLRRIGGFTHGYVYGGEDLDLALKVLEQGRRVVCSGRSILIHRFSSTRRKYSRAEWLDAGRRNRRLLWGTWGPRLRREYELDRLAGGGSWAARGQAPLADPPSREEVLSLGFCLRSGEPSAAPDDPLDALQAKLSARGHRSTVLRGDANDDLVAFNYDVAVHMRGPTRYVPRPAQLNVLWAVGDLDSLTAVECGHYDLVLSADSTLSERLREAGSSTPAMTLGLAKADPASELIDAVLARAEELDFPTRISPRHGTVTDARQT
jgi:GT2 family glycosyltransferase